MKYAILAVSLSSCTSIWPQQCEWSWRGQTSCKCKQINFRVLERKRVYVECDGTTLPIEVSGTGVSVENR